MEFGLVALWLVAYLALGAAALPVAAVLFRWVPGRGAGVALPIGLVLLALPAYWVGHLAFGLPALAAGLLVLAGAGAGALRYGEAEPDWTAARDAAAVFAVAFGFMVAVRAVDPAVHPILGEKFLDFGMLRALLRAPALPPEDFWFAGEPVRYYYGGHLVASLLAMLTGTGAAYAYNLALAGFYAALVTAAFGVGGAVAASRGASRRAGGLAGAFFVGVASNLSTPGRFLLWIGTGVVRAVTGVVGLLVSGLPDWLAGSLLFPFVALREVLVDLTDEAGGLAHGPGHFEYWAAHIVIEDTNNEFPLFAWLNGDMHAHMMVQPFQVLVAALLLAYFLTPPARRRRRAALVYGCVPAVGGLIAFTNTWTYPTVAGLTAVTVLLAPADPTTLLPGPVGSRLRALAGVPLGRRSTAEDRGTTTDGGAVEASEGRLAARRVAAVGRIEGVRIVAALGVAAVVGLVGLLPALPFVLDGASAREVAWLGARHRSSLGGLLLVHGGFLLVFAVYLWGRLPVAVRRHPDRLLVGLAILLTLGVAYGAAAVGLFVPLVLLPWALARRDDGVGYEAVLVAAGAGLALLVEFVYVVDQAAPVRYNTVFKTYAQVWVLWGVAAGATFGTLVYEHVLVPLATTRTARTGSATADGGPGGGGSGADDDVEDAGPGTGGRGSPSDGREGPRPAAVAAAILLVLSLSLYAGFASAKHFAGHSRYPRYQTVDDPTLNATRFVGEGHPGEAPAIRWLDAREGTPTIVTAAPGGYRWRPSQGKGASAPASLTGLPTVAGWFHERGYRGGDVFSERVADVRAIYTADPETRACLLAKYDVEYVYVGPAERAEYGRENVDFTGVPGVGEPVRRGDVLVYPVDSGAIEATGC